MTYLWAAETWYPAVHQDGVDATTTKNFIAAGEGTDPIPIPAPRTFAAPPAPRPPGVFNRIFKQVQRIKLHPGYTEGIGRDLGILPVVNTAEHPVPESTASAEQGPKGMRVRIDYTKYGHGGVVIESRINAGIWAPLGHFTQKTVYDERALSVAGTAETRDYRLRWWDKDEAHGDWSSVQTVLVGA